MESQSIQSSPLAYSGKENATPDTFTSPRRLKNALKPRKPPTVTPKRFSRFFTPRASLNTRNNRNSRVSRQLKDITKYAVNSRGLDRDEVSNQDFPSLRPSKRRKFAEEPTSSPPQSSPIKCQHSPQRKLHVLEDDIESVCSSRDESDLFEEEPIRPILRLRQSTTSHRLLTRSFGDHQLSARAHINADSAALAYSSTADFASRPEDSFVWRKPLGSLAFSTAACNTNSLVAVGGENGRVHMLDTSPSADFRKPHVHFPVYHNAIMDMAFSPCDYILAAAGGDQTCRVIDMQTQQTLSVLAGHKSSVKQIRFRPDDNKLLTSSGRDGLVNVWDLRCSERAVQTLVFRPSAEDDDDSPPTNLFPYASMIVGPAHRAVRAVEKIVKIPGLDDNSSVNGVSITSIEHLTGSRGHLLLSASEGNSSLKLFDLRVAGRNTKSDRFGYEVPVACTPPPPGQQRHYGVSSLVLSTDGSRAYSICKDNTVWVYSTQHLILGSAPESINFSKRTRLSPPEKSKEGSGPLYGIRNPALRISNFYIRAALRKATPEHEELLAVGSQDKCAVVFSTDERTLRSQAKRAKQDRQIARPSWLNSTTEACPVEIFENVGTPLVRGHSFDVTTLAFAHSGELVTNGDDHRVRCWRQNQKLARHLRQCGEGQGQRWGCGWADVPAEHDDDDE
ncbi:hypothetical protein AMS68_000025 [Peltaster fructicola]|uniref:Uncharacterized protein n=1 Tax=Peltaster fructicola TaxID=286661 RepID=A0A6H0XIN4_9PEZI|nr:hypothetical protein AMS68_000025 [Peltaster fructicola]